MAWQFNIGNPNRDGKQNLWKDFGDSMLAGVTNQKPAWSIQQDIDRNKAQSNQTQKKIEQIREQKNDPVLADAVYNGSWYGGGGGGGGSSYAASSREKANTIGMLDAELDRIGRGMGNLDTMWGSGRNQILDAKHKGLSRLNEQQSNALSRYETKRGDTKRDFSRSTSDIDGQAFNNYNALMGLLGRSGAGSSSAAETLTPYAVSQSASKQRGEVSDSYGRNMRDLRSAEDETKQSYKNSVRDLDDQERTQLGNLENDIQSKRSAYERQRGDLLGKKAQANGGDWNSVKNAMDPARRASDDIERGLAGLLDRYRNPYSVKDVTVKDPTLSNYAVDTKGVAINDPNGSGTDTDTSPEYLARLKEEDERKRRASAGIA